jgi:spermidine synthase
VADYYGFGGALSRTWDKSKPPMEVMGIWQDGAAFTGIVNLENKSPKDDPILGAYMQACAYVLRPGAKSLIIGPGGGVDVAIALHHDSSHVTAVDINPWTIRYVRDKYKTFAGGLYSLPNVDAIVDEGRHFLTATDKRFDVIQLSGVDTFTALSAGAYALSENYLYTKEAITDCLNVLGDDGVLSYSRWLFAPPRESLRLALTARKALEARGIENPDQHILVLAAPAWEGRSPWADIMIKKRPFRPDEVSRIREWARRLRFDVIYDPLLPYAPGGPFDALEGTPKYKPAECAREFDKVLRLPTAQLATYENDYQYRISPCSDDSPFFFNYYRFSNLRHPFVATLGGDPVNRLPLGLIILIAALVQVIIIGGLFILWPMRSTAAGLRDSAGAASVLTYFGAIGLGFIAVEIMLLQKLTVFLGGPVYSMSVTLFSLLVFCGIGSLAAKVFTRRAPRAGGIVILLLVAAAIYGTTWALNNKLPGLMHLSQIQRELAAILALLPIGLLMGMPFPTGVRVAERLNPGFIPWGWCVNGCATVLGSVASILVAMFTSFTTVLYIGMGLYLLAMVALIVTPRPRG